MTKPGQLEHHILRSSAGPEDESLGLLASSRLIKMLRTRPPWREQSRGMFRDQAWMIALNLLGSAILEAKFSWDFEVSQANKTPLYFPFRSAWVLF